MPPSGVKIHYMLIVCVSHYSLIKNPAERADLKQLMVSVHVKMNSFLHCPTSLSSYTSFLFFRCIPLSNSLKQSRLTLLAGCAAPLDSTSQWHPPMVQQCETSSRLQQIPIPQCGTGFLLWVKCMFIRSTSLKVVQSIAVYLVYTPTCQVKLTMYWIILGATLWPAWKAIFF